MSLSLTVRVDPDIFAKLTLLGRAIEPEFRRMMLTAERYAKLAVSGDVLNVVTGRLRSGLTHTVEKVGETWIGRLGSAVIYAAIHEFGGVIPAHVVVPRKPDGVLRFQVGGSVVFARYAHIPAVTMPPRPYLRPSIERAAEEFVDRIERMAGA